MLIIEGLISPWLFSITSESPEKAAAAAPLDPGLVAEKEMSRRFMGR
jgi:hypothetical protein